MTVSNNQRSDTIFQYLNPANNGINRITENKIKDKFLNKRLLTNKFRLTQ
ncbi:MAG: hypothetical protein KAT57_12650 [Candidatus Lokiarchaeota archaeon]|nr:hypothetical protein [Candidatus Lokiarchaeota archaeon]